MIELHNDTLSFSFPGVHADAECSVSFVRTLRIPDDNKEHYLPPGFGHFPMRHVEDYADRLPASWAAHGGTLLPMYQAEALWISFHSSYPMAVKIAAGKINAVTGKAWSNALSDAPQDYLVVPEQPWLDGFCVRKGLIRQFVAMPLGAGYTAEEQLTGTAEHGGLQVVAYPMKADHYAELEARRAKEAMSLSMMRCLSEAPPMGLAPGGLMRQEIYKDPHGIDAWDMTAVSRCFVHILNSTQWFAATGNAPPHPPATTAEYTNAGLPWFDYYAGDLTALEGAKPLAGLDSVAAKAVKAGERPFSDHDPADPLPPGLVVKLRRRKATVGGGTW